MARLTDVIPRGSLVGIDSVAFVYYFESVAGYARSVAPLFDALADGHCRAATSVITLLEITVRPYQREQLDIAAEYEVRLSNLPRLTVLNVDPRIARRAADLRARRRLHPMDSIQIATALEAGAATFVTNDRRLAPVSDLKVLLLDDFLSG